MTRIGGTGAVPSVWLREPSVQSAVSDLHAARRLCCGWDRWSRAV